jgi:hypothetical protein
VPFAAGFGATSFGSFFWPAHDARAPLDGLEGTEAGDGDLATLLGQLALHGVDHRFQCVLGLAAVSVEVHCERFDQLALVHCFPP